MNAPAVATALRVHPLASGALRIEVNPPSGESSDAPRSWTTRYPLDLIHAIHATKGFYVCDEIMREEDPRYVERAIRHEVLGYLEPRDFAGKRLLDFGCGAGASTMVMSRLLPSCEIVGIELQERLLKLARLRAEALGKSNTRFFVSPSGASLPAGIGEFDYVVLSAVFEHLLPHERPALLPHIWSHLKPGGVLFINQTPHRWSPVEMHTTGLPFINYLPDRLAFRLARFSGRVKRGDDWTAMLRAGIRGATIREILNLLGGTARASLLPPRQEVGDQIDLWYGKLSRRHAWLKKGVWGFLKLSKPIFGVQLVPELTLAVRKT